MHFRLLGDTLPTALSLPCLVVTVPGGFSWVLYSHSNVPSPWKDHFELVLPYLNGSRSQLPRGGRDK